MKLNVIPQALINIVMRMDLRCLNDVSFYLKKYRFNMAVVLQGTRILKKGNIFCGLITIFNKDEYFTWFKKPVLFFFNRTLYGISSAALYASPGAVNTNPSSIYRERIT